MQMTLEQSARLDDYFAPVPCPYKPAGAYVLVQERQTPKKTKGGVWVADSTRDLDKNVQSVAKVIAFGPTAGIDELSGELYPDWPWYEAGSYVLLPRSSGARYEVGDAVFRLVQVREIFAEIVDVDQILR